MKINKDFRNLKNVNELNSFSNIYKTVLDNTVPLKQNYSSAKNNLFTRKIIDKEQTSKILLGNNCLKSKCEKKRLILHKGFSMLNILSNGII